MTSEDSHSLRKRMDFPLKISSKRSPVAKSAPTSSLKKDSNEVSKSLLLNQLTGVKKSLTRNFMYYHTCKLYDRSSRNVTFFLLQTDALMWKATHHINRFDLNLINWRFLKVKHLFTMYLYLSVSTFCIFPRAAYDLPENLIPPLW
jgi:hypothetical protein